MRTYAVAPARTSSVLLGLGLWLAAALAVGASPLLPSLQPPLPQAMLVLLATACLGTVLGVGPLRAWVFGVDPRAFVAVHLTRFVGAYFLVLYGRGELPYGFAVVGGWGDIGVAAAAVGLLLWGPPRPAPRRRAYALWNALGLADILLVIAAAARAALADASSMQALLRLPLNLLITFLVPLILVTHVVLGYRLARATPA